MMNIVVCLVAAIISFAGARFIHSDLMSSFLAGLGFGCAYIGGYLAAKAGS